MMKTIRKLEKERDEHVKHILAVERQYEGNLIKKEEYLEKRKRFESELIFIMDQIARKTAFEETL